MMRFRFLLLIVFIFFLLPTVRSQANLQFIENKGQWNSDIAFRGNLPIGSFAIQNDGGFRMLLYSPTDYAALSPHQQFSKPQAKYVQQINANGQTSTVVAPPMEEGNNGSKVMHGHIYQVKFLNANPNPQIIPDKPLATANNYLIGNDPKKWGQNCKVYQAVTCKNIYPNIDVRYYTTNGALKYDIIVNPGGNVNNIALYYDGVDALKQKNGELIIQTSVQNLKEAKPYSYAVNLSGKIIIPCNYIIKGNIVRFSAEKTDPTSTLVIDPQFVFSSFSGSTAENWGYTATYDNSGNFYAGGIVFAGNNQSFPVSNGAFQTTFQGGVREGELTAYDVALMKFDATGRNRVYATYLGGNGNEQPHSLITDNAGNLIIAGRTSSSNFPVTNKVGPGGGFDIFITKLNANGTGIVGSLVIGGTGDDGVNIRGKYTGAPGYQSTRLNYGDDARSEVIIDGSGNIYLAGCTQSTNFPVTANAFQKNNGGLNSTGFFQDAVVIKATSDLSNVFFSSYLGGNDNDAAFVLSINPLTNNIYVAGGTASTNFPGTGGNVKFPTYQGGICDGFVSIISNDGSQLISSSYFGTSGADMLFGVQFDKLGFPYIMGTTNGTWQVVNSPFNQTQGQTDGKQFICKLKPDLSDFIYSATFGAPGSAQPNISPTAFLVDRCENVYVSGWGGGIDIGDGYLNSGVRNMSTPNYLQNTTDGADFYFFVLEKNAQSQLFGSYFGQNGALGDHVDGGTSRFDKNGIIYQTICSCKEGLPPANPPLTGSPPYVFSTTNNGPDCNMMALKIAFNLAGISSGIQAAANGIARDTTGCVPLLVDFADTVAQGKTYTWNFNDGSAQITTTQPKTSHTFQNVGFYKVMLVSTDPNSCNVDDTSYVTIRVRNDAAVLGLNADKVGGCQSLTFQFNNTSTAPANKPFNGQSFKLNFGDGTSVITGNQVQTHTYPAEGIYNVSLVLQDTSYCNYNDSVVLQIRIAANVKAAFETPPIGCVPYTAIFNNTSTGGTQFNWSFGDGTTSTDINPTHQYNDTGSYTVKLVAYDPNTCNQYDSITQVIQMKIKSIANFSVAPQPPITNTPIQYTNLSQPASSYKWLFGDGDSTITYSISTPVSHIYDSTKTYTACLQTTNESGCIDEKCLPVNALISPLFDVPKAFSPNGDGINDKIYVQGYGITKMKWNIYNRWGKLVYQGFTKSGGWDGTYNGVLQPQDVYHYVLLIETSDGKKFTKTGDITLLR
jgi:gliding motility-associated-like protein